MNREPTGTRTTHCSACGEPAAIANPLPLCGACSLRGVAAYADANLPGGAGTPPVRQNDTELSRRDRHGIPNRH